MSDIEGPIAHHDREDDEPSIDSAEKVSKSKNYLVNIRGILPLYFFRYYFVIIIGEDKRKASQDVLRDRRCKTAFLANVLFFLFVIFPYFIIFIVFLYFFKQSLGIDIFPNIHWPNVIRDFFLAV